MVRSFFLSLSLLPCAVRSSSFIELTNRLAEVDRVLELLPEDGLARVAGHLEEEEASVALGQEIVGWVVLVHDLWK